jgi:hypothetical protein
MASLPSLLPNENPPQGFFNYDVNARYAVASPIVEGSEGITALSLSPSKKHIAICERADRAICLIWDISGLNQNPPVPPKRKKVLSSSDYVGKEFISVCFATSAEKSLLATLVRFFIAHNKDL